MSSKVGQTIGRSIRVVWATVMSAVSVALGIGAIQVLAMANKNPWESVVFKGILSQGQVTGSYQWKGQTYQLNWPGTNVPRRIQLNTSQPTEVRLAGLTGATQRSVAYKMLLLAGAILAIAWIVVYIIWIHGDLIVIK